MHSRSVSTVYGFAAVISAAAVFAFAAVIANTEYAALHPIVATAAVIDLTITAPIAYLLFATRSRLPKAGAIPIFFAAAFSAPYLLPAESARLFTSIWAYVLPFAELAALTLITVRAWRAARDFRRAKGRSGDAFDALRHASSGLFGAGRFADALAFELAVVYYGLVAWRREPAEERWFSYTKGKSAIYLVLVFLLCAETVVIHVLVSEFSLIVAWILTISSAYVAFQLIAHLKAMRLRPVGIEGGELRLRYGLFGDAAIPLGSIGECAPADGTEDSDTRLGLLGPMEPVNVRIEFDSDQEIRGFYGLRKTVSSVLLYVDDPESFLRTIKEYEPL